MSASKVVHIYGFGEAASLSSRHFVVSEISGADIGISKTSVVIHDKVYGGSVEVSDPIELSSGRYHLSLTDVSSGGTVQRNCTAVVSGTELNSPKLLNADCGLMLLSADEES